MLAVALVFLGVGVGLWASGALEVRRVGYLGLFGLTLLSSGSIIVPVPGLAAVCIVAAPEVGLNPLAVALISALAQALGELSGYLAGRSGANFLQKNRYYPRVQTEMQRHGAIVLFVLAAIPNPVFDVAGMAAGSLKYPIQSFLAFVFAGKVLKSVGIAYGCYYSVGWISKLL